MSDESFDVLFHWSLNL